MKVKPIEEIRDFCAKIAASLGMEVPEVDFKQGKNPVLTIFIDKKGGVDLNACETFHNAIDAPLDELDPTFGMPYTLNVSSLGIDRPFKKEEDFTNNINQEVEVKLFAPIRGKKYYEGILESFDGKTITLRVDAKTAFTVELSAINKINKAVKFD